MVNASDPEVWGSSPTRVKPCCVLEQGTFISQVEEMTKAQSEIVIC